MPKENTDHSLQELVIIEDEALAQGFTQIPNTILRKKDLSAGAKLTYMALLSYAWEKGSCFPGQERLADDIGAGKRSVIRYVQELQETGLLEIKRRGLGKTNVYILKRLNRHRSAKLAFQEVPTSTHQEVPKLHLEEYSVEEYSEQQHQPPAQNNHPSAVVVSASLLKERGVHPKTATALASKHPPSHIHSMVEYYDWLVAQGKQFQNGPGYLRTLVEGSLLPEGYLRAKESEKRRQQREREQAQEEVERIKQQAEYYATTSPEEVGEKWVETVEGIHRSSLQIQAARLQRNMALMGKSRCLAEQQRG